MKFIELWWIEKDKKKFNSIISSSNVLVKFSRQKMTHFWRQRMSFFVADMNSLYGLSVTLVQIINCFCVTGIPRTHVRRPSVKMCLRTMHESCQLICQTIPSSTATNFSSITIFNLDATFNHLLWMQYGTHLKQKKYHPTSNFLLSSRFLF